MFKWILSLAVLFFGLAGCSEDESSEPQPIDYGAVNEISYSEHVQPLLNEVSDFLKQAAVYPQGLDASSWSELIRGFEGGAVIIPFAAENSLLYEMLTKIDFSVEGPDSVKTAFLKRWIDEGAQNDAGQVPYENSTDLIYVCNQADAGISVIDAQAQLVIRHIDLQELGYSASAKPHHIAVEADGSAWYVSLIGENRVLKFNRDNEVLGSVETEVPGLLYIHPTSDKLYVGRSMSAVSPPSSIAVVNRGQMTLMTEIPLVFDRPHALLAQSNGKYLFSASLAENRIAVIDAATDEVEDYFTDDGEPFVYVHFSESADNSRLYATGQVSNKLHIYNVSATGEITAANTVAVDMAPWHPLTLADGSVVFGNQKSNTVSVVDPAVATISKTISGNGLSMPHGSAISNDGRYLFISNRNINGGYMPRYPFDVAAETGTVAVIDLQTQSMVKVLEIGAQPSGMGG